MKKRIDALRDEVGFTIIEVMVAIFVLLLGVLGATTLLNTANAETERNQARNGATNLVRDIIEASRALPYEQAKPTVDASGNPDNTLVNALQGMPPGNSGQAAGSSFADGDSTTAGWQIERRGVNYTVTLQSCIVDDAKDSVVANHNPSAADGSGYYCPNLPTSGTPTDANGDDYRRVRVTASWTSNSCNSCSQPNSTNSPKTYSITQTGVIVNPTGGLGPQAVGAPTFSNATDCHTVTVSQTFVPTAVSVLFAVQDPAGTNFTATTPMVDNATGNKTFSFTYNATPPDNRYQLDITAFDSAGHATTPPVSTFLYINCHEPPNPTGVGGGFDWRRCTNYPTSCSPGERVFDIDWNSSPDADVLGYYVWRVNDKPDWDPADTQADTKVSCVSRSLAPPTDTTTIPGPQDFLEPFQPSCYDAAISNPFNVSLPGLLDILDGQIADYWVQAVDSEPTNNPSVKPTAVRTTLTNHSTTLHDVENMLNIRPTSPILSVTNDNGLPCLSWTDSTDVTATNGNITSPVRYYRIYRDANPVATVTVIVNNPGGGNTSVQVQDVPYKDRIGRAQPNLAGSCDTGNPSRSWFKDTAAGSTDWHYWVTAVDQKYLESFASNMVNWSSP